MTAKERASRLAKDMVRAYEVSATMKDLDGVVYAWTRQAEQAITTAVEAEREACARLADDMSGIKSIGGDIGDAIRARSTASDNGGEE